MKKKMYFLLLLAFVGLCTKMNAQNITTIAGDGRDNLGGDGGPATSASLTGPISITRDASGNTYIIEAYRKCVRKVTTTEVLLVLLRVAVVQLLTHHLEMLGLQFWLS
jgi:hypothetical protein